MRCFLCRSTVMGHTSAFSVAHFTQVHHVNCFLYVACNGCAATDAGAVRKSVPSTLRPQSRDDVAISHSQAAAAAAAAAGQAQSCPVLQNRRQQRPSVAAFVQLRAGAEESISGCGGDCGCCIQYPNSIVSSISSISIITNVAMILCFLDLLRFSRQHGHQHPGDARPVFQCLHSL
jgi:hypothetical protein